MIYYLNKPVKVIAVDQSLIGIVSLDRPLSHSFWVKASQLTADEGLVEIFRPGKRGRRMAVSAQQNALADSADDRTTSCKEVI
jgi:hypothetical protein